MSFPVILDPTLPPNTGESPSLGAGRIRAIVQNFIDLFNLPSATNISAALTINRLGPLTNNTGVTLNAGDVAALDLGNDTSVVLSDVQGSARQFVVALATITNAATGVFGSHGQVTVTVQGAVTRGNYLRKSTTTKALEDTGVAQASMAGVPEGAVGVALTAAGGPGAGTVTAQMFGRTHTVGITGAITPWGGATAPLNHYLCDGTAYSRTTDAALFAVIGTAFGAGDGSTTFNVPDLRGRMAIGAGLGAGLTNRVLGASVGTEAPTFTGSALPAVNFPFDDDASNAQGGITANVWQSTGGGIGVIGTAPGAGATNSRIRGRTAATSPGTPAGTVAGVSPAVGITWIIRR